MDRYLDNKHRRADYVITEHSSLAIPTIIVNNYYNIKIVKNNVVVIYYDRARKLDKNIIHNYYN